MNDLGLSKDLLKAAADLLKSNQPAETNLQEKIRRDNLEGKRSTAPNQFADAYASVVAEERKKEAERQAAYSESAKKAHGRMGKSIVENTVPSTSKEKDLAAKAEPKDKITKKDILIARGVKLEALQQIALAMQNVSNNKRSNVHLDEQRESIHQIARSFVLSMQNVLAESTLSMFEIHNIIEDFRKSLFLSTNVGNAVQKINEVSKLAAVIKKHIKEPEAEKPAAKEGIAKMTVTEEAEEVNELKKSTIASYAKKASHDARMNQSMAKDAEAAVDKYRKPDMKAAASRLATTFKKKAWKREAGVNQAIDRLAKEEVEIEEGKYVPDSVHINPDEKFAKEKAASHNAAVEKAKQMAKQRLNKEEKDTPGNSYDHQCAIHVKHAKLGEGKTLFSQHAEPAEDGTIAWYDVMFEHGIEKHVPTMDLEILVSESHMNHKKRK